DNNAIGTDVFGPLTAGVTYYILLDPEDASVTSTHTFDITCPAGAPPPCTTNLTPANGATGVSPVTLTWNAATGATGYNVFFGTTNPPTTNIGSTGTTTTNITATLPGTTYYWYIQPTNTAGGATGCETGTFSFTTAAAPVNDTVCGAITLTVGGPQDCKNTTTASSVGDPTLPGSCSSPNNTVWYKYTPAANGTVVVRTEIPGTSTAPLNGWVSWYTATGTCPSPPGLTLTALAGSACQEFGQTGAGDIDSLTSPALTGGTTYYIMIDGFAGDAGDFCISLIPPPAPPACTSNLLPANGATGVVISPAPTISWNPAANATSYDVYFGTTDPPTTNIGNSTATSATITGLSYNTTYYWYVVPKNTGGSATGCQNNTTSFTTENPANCTPIYGTGCSQADSLTYFSLKGASGTVIYNRSGATCNTSPVAYSDYTGAFSPVTLVRGESFGGFMRTGDPNDYASIWIDGNDNGYFEDNERLMNNLKIGTTMKLYTLYIPTTVPLGTHRMRVRVIYSGTAPTTPTHPCNPYTWGETEDYQVTVTNVGSTHLVATGTPGSCVEGGQIVIDAASNNNGTSPVFMVDSLNNYIAAIYPNGNNLGTVTPSTYVHNGPVRQDVTGRYYLDRTITINVTTQPISAYSARLFYRNSELNALIAQPGSGVTSQFDLVSTKSGIYCNPGYNGAGTVIFPTGFGSLSGDRFLDFTGLTSFSSFYFHGGASPLLPINLLSFAGQREGLVNRLRWTTASENNSRGFDVQRSSDGINYESIGFVNSLAPGGNSSDQLIYSFADNNVGGRKWYYRLRLVDLDGRNSLSNVVLIKGEKPVTMSIEGIYPNPANTKVNVMVAAPVRDKLTLVVTDMTGKNVMQQIISAEAGSNTIPLDISRLTGGS
ncbi:MAG: hypothetical protein JNM88_19875, partial [Chitinophagaceae bacterium]|nr:hypothetical protein [Chitinophagaceae bacterium]